MSGSGRKSIYSEEKILVEDRRLGMEKQRGGGGFYEHIVLTKPLLSEVSVKG